MSERKSYEDIDREFSNLPLPDEETSWQKMKERLDQDDDGGTIVPPVLLRSCMGWGLLLLAGLIVAWLVIRPERWLGETRKPETSSTSNNRDKQTNFQDVTPQPVINQEESDKVPDHQIHKGEKKRLQNTSAQPYKSRPGNNLVSSKAGLQKNKALGLGTEAAIIQKPDTPGTNTQGNKIKLNDNQNNDLVKQGKEAKKNDSSLLVGKQQMLLPADSLKNKNLRQQSDPSLQKKSSTTEKKLIVAAGVGLQQLIPIAGQTLVPYSYYGRDGSIADYIPSVYLQLHNKERWFMMGEFRFGAAQSVKEFSYNRKTRFDTSTMNTTVTTMRLKKTYYHQLPFSFNYYLLPNLSVGIGGMYSRFYGAVTEKETDTWNSLTQKYTNVKEIIPMKHFNDSFLYKTQVHFLLQADYQWKRFSFGLRYTRDVQPYIKYTKPDGTVDEKRNQSLQLMLHYRIWQSAKL